MASHFKKQIRTKISGLLSHLPPSPFPLLRFLFPGPLGAFLLPLQSRAGFSHAPLVEQAFYRLLAANDLHAPSIPERKTAPVHRLKSTKAQLHKCLGWFYSPSSSPQWATRFVEHQPIRRRWEGKGLSVLWSPKTGHSPQSRWQFWICFWGWAVPHNPTLISPGGFWNLTGGTSVQFVICRFTSLLVFIISNKL